MADSSTNPAPTGELREIRYVLAEMLAEVAAEREAGGFGRERIRPADVRKLVREKTRNRRAHKD